jgi:hypothetical protein
MSEAYAARLLREVRWSNGVGCICCGSGSKIYTDSYPSYNILQSIGYRHMSM